MLSRIGGGQRDFYPRGNLDDGAPNQHSGAR